MSYFADVEVRYVEWIDAAHKEGWLDPDVELKEFGVSNCKIVGFVIRETDEELLLAQSVDTRHGNVDSVMAIPKVAIVRQSTILGYLR